MICMPYFERGVDGSLIPLASGQGVTLGVGDGGRATFFVGQHPCFADIATVVRTGEEVSVTLNKTGGDIPPDGMKHDVGRQGVTIFNRLTGEILEVVHARD